jgi:hypothetical protein
LTGAATAAAIRSATITAWAESSSSSSSTANSSPPNRATVSVLAHAPLQPPRHGHQQLVAHVVAERVVDHLEAVQVQEEDGGRRRLAAAVAHQGGGQALHEEGAVGEPRQRVVHGVVQEARVALLALRHVLAEEVHGAQRRLRVVEPRQHAPADAHLHVAHPHPHLQRAAHDGHVVFGKEVVRALHPQLQDGALDGGVGVAHRPLRVALQDRRGGGAREGRQPRALLLRPLAPGDVARVDDDAAHGGVVQQVGAHALEDPPAPVAVPHAELQTPPAPGRSGPSRSAAMAALRVFGVHQLTAIRPISSSGENPSSRFTDG